MTDNNNDQPAIVAELGKLRETIDAFVFRFSVKFFAENAKQFKTN